MLISGTPAPDLALQDTTGKRLRLTEFRGSTVLLYFMRSTTCPVCNHHVKDLVARRATWADHGVTVLVVVPEGHDAALAWRTKRGLGLRVVTGGDGSPYESVGLTTWAFGSLQQSGSLLVDPDGVVRHAHGSTLPTGSYDVRGILQALEELRPAISG